MTDALLSSTDREEALSRVYVSAVAAKAGFVTTAMDFDRDGVDLGIRAGGAMRPCLDIQLKATINLRLTQEGHRFPLKRRNYDLLREPTMVPRILVLLALPGSEDEWLTLTAEKLILRKCAYWASLSGFPPSDNKDTVTISIQDAQRFDEIALVELMRKARSGTLS